MASVKVAITQPGISRPNTKWRTLWKYRALVVLALPGILLMLINNYLPMFGIFWPSRTLIIQTEYGEANGTDWTTLSFCLLQTTLG